MGHPQLLVDGRGAHQPDASVISVSSKVSFQQMERQAVDKKGDKHWLASSFLNYQSFTSSPKSIIVSKRKTVIS